MNQGEILVIDLFAGPGGLGEGISSCKDDNGNFPFQIGVSVEKEASAHKTLTTRAFYRKLKDNPDSLADYHRYLEGKISRSDLFDAYPQAAEEAQFETLQAPRALGDDNERIHARIKELCEKHKGPRVVIGGPPCQAYSLAGRSRNAGIKDYKAENDTRNFLYKEYLEVISIAQPEVFVMENVRGILSAKVAGELMFPKILADLREPGKVTDKSGIQGYRIYSLVEPATDPSDPIYKDSRAFLIKAENYGVPQARHRVILLGIREDVDRVPDVLRPADENVTVEQAIGDLPPLRSGFSKRKDDAFEWEVEVESNSKLVSRLLAAKFNIEKPADLLLMLKPQKALKRKTSTKSGISLSLPEELKRWYSNNAASAVLNHETRGHMDSDLLRYAFSAGYTELSGGTSPKARDFPEELAPNHDNWKSGSHADRFRTQAADKCATTVTSHISKDGHYFIHYDPSQCRSLTVREAARLQTFPDNYIFEGNRTQQYVQVGNAVPPFLAHKIGDIVVKLLR
ncbi:DNA cytosine methyltransferase [Grimontia kaedaensis]|uniref:DNA (cytosine-5-)-methyltransferase n=1 Tax=Grimontia kaedaensis TaxID=2872157 RepID=A0ABY4WRJ7_9GAMM|nr:DNA cytosine methyltransferase [Grimontia kaedaensis]USH01910.1 DNA cytosine methyltransferase [Grimontia kaedaensis]